MNHSRRFLSAHRRIQWAQENIVDLQQILESFAGSSHDKGRSCNLDRKSGQYVDKIAFPEPFIHNVTRHTVQAIEHLRSALDHAACAVCPHRNSRSISFPFAGTKREMRSTIGTKCKRLPNEITALFMAFKPYKRGNPPLWALNNICNTFKHRAIIRPDLWIKDAELQPFSGQIITIANPKWDRRKNEIIISKSPTRATTFHHDIEFSFAIVFGKVYFFQGKAVLTGLRKLMSIVKGIVMATEEEARRIGIT